MIFKLICTLTLILLLQTWGFHLTSTSERWNFVNGKTTISAISDNRNPPSTNFKNDSKIVDGSLRSNSFAGQQSKKLFNSKERRNSKIVRDKSSEISGDAYVTNKVINSKDTEDKWRIFNINVNFDDDEGKDCYNVQDSLRHAVIKTLKQLNLNLKPKLSLQASDIKIVRKAFDGRWRKLGQPLWVYTVDVNLEKFVDNTNNLKIIEGKIEKIEVSLKSHHTTPSLLSGTNHPSKPRIVIVGSGPAGLFTAITLVEAGFKPIILERGYPVEQRGKDIGALFNRKILNPDSNLCYGEGGAGTWSDGKLTTQIGKNSDDVRYVLETLVRHGAPDRILVDGKPHLGTDRLVRILRNLRQWLTERGAEFEFGCRVEDFDLRHEAKTIFLAKDGEKSSLNADVIVLAVGHSARPLYERLIDQGVQVIPKPIAVGFRVEHPQDLINQAQFGKYGQFCERGNGKVPVADYKLTASVIDDNSARNDQTTPLTPRSCYSFCMCPGGQIVPTSVDPTELCINGMSFSKRQSRWANAALVVGLTPEDIVASAQEAGITEKHLSGPYLSLLGIEWQRAIERKAAIMGGGSLVCPVQRVTDFMGETATIESRSSPLSSSYRLGVRGSSCHLLYPKFVTNTLKRALLQFERRIPGFISDEGLLHGVETRTSCPIQIYRDSQTFMSNIPGLFPAGEGAGYAGGIVRF